MNIILKINSLLKKNIDYMQYISNKLHHICKRTKIKFELKIFDKKERIAGNASFPTMLP